MNMEMLEALLPVFQSTLQFKTLLVILPTTLEPLKRQCLLLLLEQISNFFFSPLFTNCSPLHILLFPISILLSLVLILHDLAMIHTFVFIAPLPFSCYRPSSSCSVLPFSIILLSMLPYYIIFLLVICVL